MKKALLILILAKYSLHTLGQDLQRVAPQVTSTTMVIDQNSSSKTLKENLLNVMKNAGQEEFQAYFLIIKAVIDVVKNDKEITTHLIYKDSSKHSQSFKAKNIATGDIYETGKNEIILLLKLFQNVEGVEDNLLDIIKDKITTETSAPLQAKAKALELLEKWKTAAKTNIAKCIKKTNQWIAKNDRLGKIYISSINNNQLDVVAADIQKLINNSIALKLDKQKLAEDLKKVKSLTSYDAKVIEKLQCVNYLGFYVKTLSEPTYQGKFKKLFSEKIISPTKQTDKLIAGLNDKILDDKLLSRISSLINLSLTFININKPLKVKDVCENLADYLPSIIGLNIEEQDRIKATTEIIFCTQNFIEDFKVKSNANELDIKIGSSNPKIAKSKKVSELIDTLITTVGDQIKSSLSAKLGANDAAVVHFDIFYAKIKVQLKSLRDNPDVAPVLNKTITEIETLVDKSSKNLEEYLKTQIIELVSNHVDKTLKDGLKNPSRIAWINNFNTQQGGAELNTTVAYKIINRPTFIWEASTNFFYNTLRKRLTAADTALQKKDTSSLANQMFVGSNWRWITRNNKLEFGIVSAISGQSINNLHDLRTTRSLHSYLGVNVGIKAGSAVYRPYYEWEFQQTKDGKDLNHHNLGIEVKLPDKYVISGFFVNYKINDRQTNTASLGIKFPIIK